MDSLEKLAELNQYSAVEAAEDAGFSSAAAKSAGPCRPDELEVFMAAMPNGQRMPLLKTMLTSICERNCNYCAFRSGRDFRRTTFSAEEMAQTFLKLYQAGRVKGLFLSSGMAGGGIRTQDRLLTSVEILRKKLGFRGYIHLKIMPGSQFAQVERAMQLADRVSVNLEAPTTERLANLAPQKVFIEELLEPLRWVEKIRNTQSPQKTWNGHWPSSTTQFVAGGSGESDLELLRTTEYLHASLKLSRVYFSGFSPVPGTPLENQPAINPWRQNRLYQADFLLRDYSFSLEDMPFLPSGDLPLDVDPKLAWARCNLSQAPVEVNRAALEQLLRVPGIGPRGARSIISARSKNHLHRLEDLKALGIRTTRAAPFILLDGHCPPSQPALW